jgi:hypothetical protein
VSRLTAEERECIIGATDKDNAWRVYMDTSSRFARRLLETARAWNIEPQRCGSGVEFELPFRAIRFSRPRQTTARQRDAARRSIQKARNALTRPGFSQAAEESGASGAS